MKKLIGLCLFLFAFIGAHIFTLRAAPSVIMTKAVATMSERGIPPHRFVMSKRLTPETQSIVRASPDLAYSLCLFDLSKGPVLVRGEKWDGYGSLTIFNSVTDAAYIASLDASGSDFGSVILTLDDKFISKAHPIAVLKNPKGIALIRRLAPTVKLFEAVQNLSKSDVCTHIE